MDDLAPLPSTFDADFSPPQSPQADLSLTLESCAPLFERDLHTASPPVYDDLESRSGTPPPLPGGRDCLDAEQVHADAMTGTEAVYEYDQTAQGAEDTVDGMDVDEGDRPAPETELWGFLAQLQGTKEDGYNEDDEEEEIVEDREDQEAGAYRCLPFSTRLDRYWRR